MRIGLIAMSGVRVRTKELAELGVTLPQFVNRGVVIASLPSSLILATSCAWGSAAKSGRKRLRTSTTLAARLRPPRR